MKTAKAWTSGISVLVLYIVGRATGAVELPPVEELGQALTDIGAAGVSFLVSYALTWLVPNKAADN